MNDERHSDADAPSLISDEQERAVREAENAIAQFDRVLDLIDMVEREGRPFRLRIMTLWKKSIFLKRTENPISHQ